MVVVSEFDPALTRRVLQLFQNGPTGLAVDIDGTLSPIAPTPAEAIVPEAGRLALKRLHQSGRLAVLALLSGRAATDGRQLVGLPDLLYLGNHGLEALGPGQLAATPAQTVQDYPPLIATVLETVRLSLLDRLRRRNNSDSYEAWKAGMLFENKGVTASIHYRLCPDPALARQEILEQIELVETARRLRVSEGRMVVELRPPVEIDKGTALTELTARYHINSLIFIGDDTTDVDGFRALRKLERATNPAPAFQGLAIGVHSPEMPATLAETADFLVEGVPGVARFLGWLATALES